jgi:hypothetical protein
MAQAVESEAAAKAALDQLRREHGFARIAETEDAGTPNISVAEQIRHDCRGDRARGNGPSRAPPERNDRPGGYAGGGPEHRDAVGDAQ